ncbi:MAG TPA: condensation domain-containing protein, partial [Terriglobia bacterium]|nr:condensation domain-containing protein [Terriglobia bacterium]
MARALSPGERDGSRQEHGTHATAYPGGCPAVKLDDGSLGTARPATGLEEGGRTSGRPAEAPLSFGQLRLWFLDQLEQGTALYNMPMALRLKGPLDRSALERALNALVARHEALRTRFVCKGEYPVQAIDESAQLELEMIDVCGPKLDDSQCHHGENTPATLSNPSPHVAGSVDELIREEINRPFNLSTDLLLRVKLLRIAPEQHVLIVTMHHIVSDEWSLQVFFNELGHLYQAFADGSSASLPKLSVQYADYALWQQEWLRGNVLKEQLDYWRERLAGRQGIFELTTDYPRGAMPSFRGRIAKRSLGAGLSARCREFQKREHVTSFMLHLAAFKALLSRYAQQGDIVVGCPIANRNLIEIEGVIGFFVNTLMLRTKVEENTSFRDLLRQVRQTTIDGCGHQELPIEKVVEELQPERSLSHLPFTRLMFAMQNELFEKALWGPLEVEFLDVATDTAKFDLTFLIQGSKEGLIARVEYNSDLFEQATIERLLEHYEVLLANAAEAPDEKISQLKILPEEERKQIVERGNQTRTNYPRTKCVHQLFEQQAAANPSAIAITFGHGSLGYRELNLRANQLARYLRRCGVTADMPVAICVERSIEMVVGMLAVLKAGGAYVPLDPEYPAERLQFMLRDIDSPVLLTQQRLLGRVMSAKPICLDADWELIARESRDDVNLPCSAEQLACVMYTSGSSGTPKGVAIPHRAITRLVLDTNYVRLRKGDRIAQVSNVSFD